MPGIVQRVVVEVLPAGRGDAILVRCPTESGRFNILIDGGLRSTFSERLADRFAEIRSEGEQLDLVIVTHIDTDHIGGILELFKANGPSNAPQIIGIGEVWHNGYRHLGLDGPSASEEEKRAVLSQVATLGESEGAEEKISVKEAETLSSLITRNGYQWNKTFGGKAVLAGSKVVLRPGITMSILSPRPEELRRLARIWKRGLATKGVNQSIIAPEFEVVFELELPLISDAEDGEADTPISYSDSDEVPDPSTFREDTSAINGSSIAFLLECIGRKFLFLADGLPSVIVDGIHGLLDSPQLVEVDLIKVSHHGSRNNTSPDLVQAVRSRIHVISTDGSKHEHPHAEALFRIVGSSSPGCSLVFNYPSATAARMDQPTVRQKYGHSVTVGTGEEPLVLMFHGEEQRGE